MDQGLSYDEAARLVGINRRTGERWRNGRNASGRFRAVPPANPEQPHLDLVTDTGPSLSDPAASRYLREANAPTWPTGCVRRRTSR
ncbi:helix-turn-helix domain-containing protein [Streptomyces sp. RB6PN23]|uniref:Helix-turn-helix domain-containing protein n=1 Tax=Streptomyces silvisoli TaxID=3034235 RepID=A0ABT5ZT34_9ACTN|nr:helix-turn-helix domain-containing protein [Streptomyces silvisoli]MDF3292987.1 helix-turn-helix domain-containing protein [Streptomyces silvisoli]